MRNLYVVVLVFISINYTFLCGQVDIVEERFGNENAPKSKYQFELGGSVIDVSNTANLFGGYIDGVRGGMYIPSEDGPSITLVDYAYMVMGGYNDEGNLQLTADAESMRPGPYLPDIGFYDVKSDWDRFWEMNSSAVSVHIADFSDNGEIDNKQELIYSWPGKGNPYFESYNNFSLLDRNEDLAPFFDNNGDGVYNPDDGDYPIIKGDRAVWWMVHSGLEEGLITRARSVHTEIEGMAYFYNESSSVQANTLFYQFKVTNKGKKLNEFRYGHIVDFSSGYNVLSGVDTTRNILFGYDVPVNDEEHYQFYEIGDTPIIGLLDISNVENKRMQSSGVYFSSGLGKFHPSTVDPELGGDYYNYISARWKDGTSFSEGGIGYDPNSMAYVNHLFPDNPADSLGWSMCNEFKDCEGRLSMKSIMSNGPYEFETDQTLVFNYAIIQADDISYPCPDISGLQSVADGVIAHYNDNITNTVIVETIDLDIYPNPAHSKLHVDMEDSYKVSQVQLNGIDGRLIFKTETFDGGLDIDVSQIENGLYFLSIFTKDGGVRAEKVVVMK